MDKNVPRSNNRRNIMPRSDHLILDVLPWWYGAHARQDTSSASTPSANVSQAPFIALLCVIGVLTVVIVIILIIFLYQYYSYRQRTYSDALKNQHSSPATPSVYTVHASSIGLQESTLATYLNSSHSFCPMTLDAKQWNSYLFIDLHSTSSDTGVETIDDLPSRFLMRERSLPADLRHLPQLRSKIEHEHSSDRNASSTITDNLDGSSTLISIATDDMNDSRTYHHHQQRIMQTVQEIDSFSYWPFSCEAKFRLP